MAAQRALVMVGPVAVLVRAPEQALALRAPELQRALAQEAQRVALRALGEAVPQGQPVPVLGPLVRAEVLPPL